MKVILDKNKLNKLLDGRTYAWLLEKLNENGVNITESAFYHVLGGRNECRMMYAFGIAKIFNVSIEEIFFVTE